MKKLINYGRISSETENNSVAKLLDITVLHPITALQVVLEQRILADYLRRVDNPEMANALSAIAERLESSLPKNLPRTILSDIYTAGKEHIDALRKNLYSRIVPEQIIDLFASPMLNEKTKDVGEEYYTPTLTKYGLEFLYIWLNLATGYVPPSAREESNPSEPVLRNSPILVPALRPCLSAKEANKGVVHSDNPLHQPINNDIPGSSYMTILDFRIDTSASAFELFGRSTGLKDILSRYILADKNAIDMVALISNFCIQRDRYDMTNSSGKSTQDTQLKDICFDLVTSACARDTTAYTEVECNLSSSARLADEVTMLADMAQQGKLKRIHNLENPVTKFILTEFLSRCGADAQLVNYFAKPAQAITGAEAASYSKSAWSLLTDGRAIPGMEDLDSEEEQDDNKEEDTSSGTEEQSDGKDTESEATPEPQNDADDAADDADDQNDTQKDSLGQEATNVPGKVDHRPDIDPKLLLLELASPVEALSDYLYRELVSRRISYILKNPPENARPDVLQFLKAWKSQWLFLVSIPTIRDFLSRVAIRLS